MFEAIKVESKAHPIVEMSRHHRKVAPFSDHPLPCPSSPKP